MNVYVCKNHDDDGDLYLAVFTTAELAHRFCTQNSTFVYYKVEITDDTNIETRKYSEGTFG